MMFIYKIKEVQICVSLREHHDVTFAETDSAAINYAVLRTPWKAYFDSYSTKIFTN